MRSFFTKLSIFIVPLVLLSVPLDYFLSQNAKKSNSCSGEYLVWNDIYSGGVNADVVIYGSSKAWVIFNPQIIEDSIKCTTYNLGIDGHNFWLEYLRHKELLKFNKKPKYIILSMDMFSLEKNKELYNLDQFLPYMLFDNDIYHYTSSYEGFSFLDYYFPLVRYIGKREAILNAALYSLNIINSKPSRLKGFRGQESEWNDDFANAKSKMNQYEVRIDSASEYLFNEFLSECSKNSIEVIMVYSPEYVEFQNFTKNRDAIISLYLEYSKKYNIPFLDYSSDILCRQKEYFYNATHLNKTGAEMFTNKLVRDLKKLTPYCLFSCSN